MRPYKLPNAAASQLTVTGTAASLQSLITTAASEDYIIPTEVDSVDLYVESVGIRLLAEGNTPTAALGIPVASGESIKLKGIDASKLQLISIGANATVSVQIGQRII
jgi:hypothetical protein